MSYLRGYLTTAACAALLYCPVNSAYSQPVATASGNAASQSQASDGKSSAVEKVDRLIHGKTDRDAAAKHIDEAMDSASDEVRWHAARAAGHLRLATPEVLEELQEGAADDNWVVQLHSIAALAQSGDKSPQTIDVLMKAVVSDNARVAAAALHALRSLEADPAQLAAALNEVLANSNTSAAVHAVEILVDAGGKAEPMLKALLKEPNAAFWACLAIAEIGPPVAGTVPELADFLNSHDKVEAVPQALMAVAAIGPDAKSAEGAVAKALKKWSNDQSVQLAGLYALGSIGATDSGSVISERSKSDDAFVAMVASWAQAKTSPQNEQLLDIAIQRLVGGLESDNATMAHAAAHGLVALDLPPGKAAPYLLKAAENSAARENMINAFASMGEEVVPQAAKALSNPETRELALGVLARIGKQAADATPALADSLSGAPPKLQVQINNVLAEIGPAASAATPALAAELKSADAHVRQSAMYALREIGPAANAAKQALLDHARETDASTREGKFERLATAWTLARIAADDLNLKKSLVPVIRQGLESDSELEREESVDAVVDLGEAGTPLLKMVAEMAKSDPSASVREEARVATASDDQ